MSNKNKDVEEFIENIEDNQLVKYSNSGRDPIAFRAVQKYRERLSHLIVIARWMMIFALLAMVFTIYPYHDLPQFLDNTATEILTLLFRGIALVLGVRLAYFLYWSREDVVKEEVRQEMLDDLGEIHE